VKNNTIPTAKNRDFSRSLLTTASLLFCLFLLSATALGAYTILPARVNYHVQKDFIISQDVGNARIYLGLLLPKTGSYQEVKNLSIQWDGSQETSSRAYVDLLKLWDEMYGEDEKMAVVSYDVSLPQGTASWQAPVDRFDLLPQEGIESSHEEITQAASRIAGETENELVHNIFKFTTNHLDYSEIGCEDTNVSALEAYRTRTGACIAYARVMVALCRASDIPAKMVIGTMLPDVLFSLPQISSSSFPGDGHAWVEYHTQDSWHLADPSCGRGPARFLVFNRNDGRHLSFGDFGHFSTSKAELYEWAAENAQPLDVQLTSIFASSSAQTDITAETTINKTWDQRWLNVVLSLGAVTFVLCKIRDRALSKYFPG
jgi:hypothetical protein